MLKTKILALILAGGEGSRLEVLTDARAKPSLPFGGSYHLIDIPLSNAVNSGLNDVWIIEQYRPHSLNEHLSNGRPWDLDRSRGGMRVLPPYSGGEGEGFASGNAEALYQNLRFLRDFGADLILVLSSDHLYKLDYRDVVAQHLDKGADVTMVTTRTDEDASRFGVVEVSADGRVTNFAYKPDEPKTDWVTAEIFLFNADVLLDTLQALVDENEDLGDYGERLLPRLVENDKAYAHEHDGYWRDLGTPESYWQAHMDLLADTPEFSLDDSDWPLRTKGGYFQPARIFETARIDNSLVSPSCTVRGEVVRSVLAPGVVVEAGARVENAVVLEGVTLESGSRVSYAVLDRSVTVGKNARVAGQKASLALVGANVVIAADREVGAGEHLEPDISLG